MVCLQAMKQITPEFVASFNCSIDLFVATIKRISASFAKHLNPTHIVSVLKNSKQFDLRSSGDHQFHPETAFSMAFSIALDGPRLPPVKRAF